MDGGEDRQRHEEDEEDVEQLRAGLLEDLPVRRTALALLLIGRRAGQGRVLLLQQLVVAIEFLQNKTKINH